MSRRIGRWGPEPSDELRVARRELESLSQITLLRDWEWDESCRLWVLSCRLTVEAGANEFVPEVTDWFVCVSPVYPLGTIEVLPAKLGGLQYTFHHQSYNEPGDPKVPWCTGKLCLDSPFHSLGRNPYDIEPSEAPRRLAWHLRRASDWLEDASHNELIRPGEPFELPQFPRHKPLPISIAFSESTESFTLWGGIGSAFGLVEFYVFKRTVHIQIVRSLQSLDGQELYRPEWGFAITTKPTVTSRGYWLRLAETPAIRPWQAPVTWGDLRSASASQGVDLDGVLRRVSESVRNKSDAGHILLVGFPIPAKFAHAPERMHWQALRLPSLVTASDQVPGFRPGRDSAWRHNRERLLKDNATIEWLDSENWCSDQLATRGALPLSITSKNVLMIGAGALGSPIAELLVRAGVHRMSMVDSDRLEAGNLVRHALDLDDLNEFKATAMRTRLNKLSPHARVTSLNMSFPPSTTSDLLLNQYDLVIDCTANNEVLGHMASLKFAEDTLFVSLSVNLGAKKLFCFAALGQQCPYEAFSKMLAPLLLKDLEVFTDRDLPRVGIGCWHPAFPARADDMWMMASVAVKQLEQFVVTGPREPLLVVYEQVLGSDGSFCGIRQVSIDPA